jgi:hypothetical protein
MPRMAQFFGHQSDEVIGRSFDGVRRPGCAQHPPLAITHNVSSAAA